MIRAIFILVAVLGSGVVSAQERFDGNKMLSHCSKAEKYLDSGYLDEPADNLNAIYCTGIIDGVIAYNMVLTGLSRDRLFCPPMTITKQQAIRVVIKYLRDNPDMLHESGYSLAILPLAKAFPCD